MWENVWVWAPSASQPFWAAFYGGALAGFIVFPLTAFVAFLVFRKTQESHDKRAREAANEEASQRDAEHRQRMAGVLGTASTEMIFSTQWARSAIASLQGSDVTHVHGMPHSEAWNSVQSDAIMLGLPLDTVLPRILVAHTRLEIAHAAITTFNKYAFAFDVLVFPESEKKQRFRRLEELREGALGLLKSAMDSGEEANGLLEEFIKQTAKEEADNSNS